MPDTLLEEVRSFEEYLGNRQAELRQLEEERDALQRSQVQFRRQVELDNGNAEARRELEKAELALVEIKKKVANHSRWTRSRVQNLRAKILQTQERELGELQTTLERNQSCVNELRNSLIPAAEQHLSELHERVRQLQNEANQVQRDIDRINRLNMDVLFSD